MVLQFVSEIYGTSAQNCQFELGLMFGYATDETEECMPLTVVLAHALNRKLAQLRHKSSCLNLAPKIESVTLSLRTAM